MIHVLDIAQSYANCKLSYCKRKTMYIEIFGKKYCAYEEKL